MRERVASLSDLVDESAVRVKVGDVPVCLARTQGEVLAVNDVCSHADVSLSEGDVEDGTVECWLHGSRFDLRTGAPTGLPATKPVATYPVTIEGGEVFVEVTTAVED
ncbi:MAG TPA: non-heme iron oxygenase ferredoxin subunit [Mycobacteriales bacterium]|nr:non-heme iron oxygenase ferredoxin subunit [Mycobacteriales bacterium]